MRGRQSKDSIKHIFNRVLNKIGKVFNIIRDLYRITMKFCQYKSCRIRFYMYFCYLLYNIIEKRHYSTKNNKVVLFISNYIRFIFGDLHLTHWKPWLMKVFGEEGLSSGLISLSEVTRSKSTYLEITSRPYVSTNLDLIRQRRPREFVGYRLTNGSVH